MKRSKFNLEQGPDVIVIGDIKDAKTAEIAVKRQWEGILYLELFVPMILWTQC